MSKILPTANIANELSRASVFFQAPTPSKPTPESDAAVVNSQQTPPTQNAKAPPSAMTAIQPSNHDSVLSRNHAITYSSIHNSKQPLRQDDVVENHLDEIRKAVKQLGKELSTHRFTAEEKEALSDIVYTYSRQGVRTSENEITRIGINWLLLDYRQYGANSALARLLERLHR